MTTHAGRAASVERAGRVGSMAIGVHEAKASGRSAYDCEFVVTARHLNVKLVTSEDVAARSYIVDTHVPLASVKAKIVAIGNSHGVRIPKPLLEQAGISGDVELHAENGRIVIAAVRRPRDGWADAAAKLRARGEDGLLDTPMPAFDGEEWECR